MLRILVLGSGAGGGSPQWNCNCSVCQKVRKGAPGTSPRTQSSLAVSARENEWFLLNASPDLRQQISDRAELHPKHGHRHSPIMGAVLTNGDVDHVAGLLNLRESQPLVVYATHRVQQVLAANNIFNVLNPEFVTRREFTLNRPTELETPDGKPSGLVVEPFTVPGKVALYLEDATKGPKFGSQPEDTIGLKVSSRESGDHFFYIPGCEKMPPDLAARLRGAPLVFFDGTLWQDDEMIANNVGVKTGARMGHMSNSGPDGTIAAFESLDVHRKIFIHINNTNPILIDGSPERLQAERAGWEVSFDGMRIELGAAQTGAREPVRSQAAARR
ncbi:MAG: pyrroloquinoline quinone biosynthesis protein PqqB [Alphaproteobacteria bacterium]